MKQMEEELSPPTKMPCRARMITKSMRPSEVAGIRPWIVVTNTSPAVRAAQLNTHTARRAIAGQRPGAARVWLVPLATCRRKQRGARRTRDADEQPGLTSVRVAHPAEQQRANRPHEEGQRKEHPHGRTCGAACGLTRGPQPTQEGARRKERVGTCLVIREERALYVLGHVAEDGPLVILEHVGQIHRVGVAQDSPGQLPVRRQRRAPLPLRPASQRRGGALLVARAHACGGKNSGGRQPAVRKRAAQCGRDKRRAGIEGGSAADSARGRFAPSQRGRPQPRGHSRHCRSSAPPRRHRTCPASCERSYGHRQRMAPLAVQ